MLEIKIVFKSGHVGIYKLTGEELTNKELEEFEEIIINAIKEKATGTFKLKDKESGYKTIINIQEVATFGTRMIESEDK